METKMWIKVKPLLVAKDREIDTDQLNQPSIAVLIDRMNDCLIISDYGNGRVMRWPLQKSKQTSGRGRSYSLGRPLSRTSDGR